jgi:hypothetical protein
VGRRSSRGRWEWPRKGQVLRRQQSWG